MKKKILVIDDELCVRWAVKMCLDSHGYALFEAGGGAEGVEIARAQLPDLVISDINMAGMDGFAVLKALRSYPETASIPVILMTGLMEKTSARYGMEQGADDYLAKPFGNEALVAAVKARLDRHEILQAQSKANEARLLQLLSVTHDLIAIADPTNGLLLYLNSAGRKMLGFGLTQNVSGLKLSDVILDSGTSMGLKARVTHAVENGSWIGEGTLIANDGKRIPVSEQIMSHQAANGQGAFLSVVARDITERKHAEAELEKAQTELVQASRQAGMAEVATGVLHNVGNALNSVNIASACMAESLRKSKTANLSRLLDLLRDHEHDLPDFLSNDPKGKQIPTYLMQLSEHLIKEQETAVTELGRLQKGVEHIKEIVTAQQNYGKVSGIVETLTVADLVDDTLRMTASAFYQQAIQVNKELDAELTMTIEKHKVMQILINLVRNAKQACDASEHKEKKLTIRGRGDGNGRVRISVSDNGCGIAPENMNRMFTLGFTTKKNGHGFGLHSSALSAKELGGALTVESEGQGKGATFTLEIPREREAKQAEKAEG